jgi:uncharacterized protein YndB with AHSA1/START domain
METLHFSIKINAPKEKVWDIMLTDKTYREWTAEFNPGSFYEGSWDKGSNIRFIGFEEDGKVSGMLGKIAENKQYVFLSIEYTGVLEKGVESKPEGIVGSKENYTFIQTDNSTELKVDLDAIDDYMDMMNEMWPKALKKLKEMCER